MGNHRGLVYFHNIVVRNDRKTVGRSLIRKALQEGEDQNTWNGSGWIGK